MVQDGSIFFEQPPLFNSGMVQHPSGVDRDIFSMICCRSKIPIRKARQMFSHTFIHCPVYEVHAVDQQGVILRSEDSSPDPDGRSSGFAFFILLDIADMCWHSWLVFFMALGTQRREWTCVPKQPCRLDIFLMFPQLRKHIWVDSKTTQTVLIITLPPRNPRTPGSWIRWWGGTQGLFGWPGSRYTTDGQ